MASTCTTRPSNLYGTRSNNSTCRSAFIRPATPRSRTTTGGVMERHPKLRAAFLEGTAGWLPWWLWRLDDQWEKFGPGCENPLSMLPSEYFKRQCYIALDVDEEPAVHAVNDLGADYFVVSSDYPHSDGAFPEAMQQFFSLPLNDEQRRKILWDNCARLYGIPKPAAA